MPIIYIEFMSNGIGIVIKKLYYLLYNRVRCSLKSRDTLLIKFHGNFKNNIFFTLLRFALFAVHLKDELIYWNAHERQRERERLRYEELLMKVNQI